MTNGEPNPLLIRLTDDVMFRCPFIMMTEVGSAYIDEKEAERLRAAQGRLPVGRRLLGKLRLGVVGGAVRRRCCHRR